MPFHSLSGVPTGRNAEGASGVSLGGAGVEVAVGSGVFVGTGVSVGCGVDVRVGVAVGTGAIAEHAIRNIDKKNGNSFFKIDYPLAIISISLPGLSQPYPTLHQP